MSTNDTSIDQAVKTGGVELVEHATTTTTQPQEAIRAQEDELSVLQAARRHWLVVTIGMIAAFSASLDGYQISLNGGIVANKGFIRQMARPGTTELPGSYVSVWGGIQSAGQTVGQIFLQYGTDSLGRKPALLILWLFLCGSIFAESFATTWQHWLVAKLFSGAGVGMLQATMPVYLAEIAPSQLRGFLINAYSFWFVVGQLCGSVSLNKLNKEDPYDFRTPIYTQWAMVGSMLIIFLLLPESPWWLVSRGKIDKAMNSLRICNRGVPGYDSAEVIEIMKATVSSERAYAEQNSELGALSVFKGRNALRTLIASWPKIAQQLVGLAVFNSYATYFFQTAGNKNPFLVTVILNAVQLLSVLLTAALTDSFGRRPLTVYPYGVTSLSVLALGIIGFYNYKTKATSSLLVFFAALATFSTTGASAIGYAYAAEVPQQRLRARTAGWALALSNCVAIIFSFCTPLMINGHAHWGVKTGLFFAITGIISTVIAWFILPEVTRRTPAEIDEMFEKRVPLRHFDTYITDVQTRGESKLHGEE